MFRLLKHAIARLPRRWQDGLRRFHYGRQIARGTFCTNEPEYLRLDTFVKSGDWVIDVGANVGHYSHRLSQLVGPTGRVMAFEPVPETFAMLTANCRRFQHQNVTLFNAAASDQVEQVGMSIPFFSNGLVNHFEAHLTPEQQSDVVVMALRLDSLATSQPVSFVKIDAEGHEAAVLAGMKQIIKIGRPTLVIETHSKDLEEGLMAIGYSCNRLDNSPNIVCQPVEKA
ncbi:MAG: FkbM family methyltransferase [Gemmatimonadales bacterium]|nr:FkbM family methyltransferase [Gemmatimonadales bacterium]MDZ4388993.1 FkbM family methyltransferase [Gemmatimonadales bacterium]